MKAQKAKKWKMEPGLGAAKFFIWDIGKTDRFWQLVGGGPQASHRMAKMQEAKMKGNEGPKGQNERK